MKRFFYLIVLWSIPFVVNAEANCYTVSDFSGTALFTYNPVDDTYTASTSTQYTAAGTPFDAYYKESECYDRSGFWGDPDTYQAATIDANLSFDNPQVLTVTSAVDGTNFLIKSGNCWHQLGDRDDGYKYPCRMGNY